MIWRWTWTRQRPRYSLVDYLSVLLSTPYLLVESLLSSQGAGGGPPSRFSTLIKRALILQMNQIMTISQEVMTKVDMSMTRTTLSMAVSPGREGIERSHREEPASCMVRAAQGLHRGSGRIPLSIPPFFSSTDTEWFPSRGRRLSFSLSRTDFVMINFCRPHGFSRPP